MSILSTREWAIFIWGMLFLIYGLCHKKIRESFWNVVVICCRRRIRRLFEIILLYVIAITIVFYHLPIWNNLYLKDIIIWFLFSGLIYCFNAVSGESDETYISKVLKNNLKLTIFLEFSMNTFTFNIWIELIIIPIITIIMVMDAIAERKEEYKNTHRLLNLILAIIGFWILYKTILTGIKEYKELNAINTLVSFMIPIVYLILIIPLMYILELYSKYELLFIRMTFEEENDKHIKIRHRIAVFCACTFSVRRVLLFQKDYLWKMYVGMHDGEFDKLIHEFKIACKNLKR